MKRDAHAKLNLALDITGRRPDGYHMIDTIMQEITLCDTLDVELCESLEVDCPGVPVEENTVAKAARLFFSLTGFKGGARIRVAKRIPAGSGLGGGSSDAAATLVALNALCGSPLRPQSLLDAATQIGADVPFFLDGGTQRARGIGEQLDKVPYAGGLLYLLAKPEQGIGTKEAYRLYDALPKQHADIPGVLDALKQGSAPAFLERASNVLLPAAERIVPSIRAIGERLLDLGALGWGLSGSGSCVFGVFSDGEARSRARASLERDYTFVACAEPFSRSSHVGA